jgi:hypothetical protein
MTKQLNKQSPAELISQAESDIRRLEQMRDAHIARGVELGERRKALSYNTHVERDAAARKQLDDVNREIGAHAPELESFGDALGRLRAKLDELRHLQACEERRAAIKESQKRSREFRELGGFLDKSLGNLRRGLQALSANAAAVGRDQRHVATTHRCLQVALFDTVFRDAFGVPDHPTRQAFATFSGVVNQWCDSNDHALARELAVLDGERTEEAA